MRIGIDDILAGHGIGTGGGSGGGRLEPKSARVTTSNVTSVVDVPATLGFNPAKDMMMVFQNSIFIDKGVDYTLSEDASTIIAIEGDWTVGTILDFLVITNTKTDLPTYDGSLIGDGTITEAKLSQVILDRIEASANFDAVLGRVNEVELKMRQLREVAANAQLQMEATDLVTSGQSFGGNGNFSFGAPMDMAKTTTTNILDVGATVLTGKVAKHDAFKVGQTVTIYDDVNTEAVVVTKSTATELEVSALTKGYKSGAVIARSTLVPHVNGGYDFPKWNAIKGPSVVRFSLGITDEAVMWCTTDNYANSILKTRFGFDQEKEIQGNRQSLSEKLELKFDRSKTADDITKVKDYFPSWTNSEVNYAQRVTTDNSGNVYVAYDVGTGNKALRKFDSTGKEIWAKTDVGAAYAVAVDQYNNVYVAHHNAEGVKTVRKLDSSGNELWSKSDAFNAYDIDVDEMGNVYVAYNISEGSKSVRKFNSNGQELWSKTDIGPTRSIRVDRLGNVYVGYNNGSPNKTIRKLNSNGQEIWSKSDVGPVYDIAVDNDGNVYTAAPVTVGNKGVRKLDSQGNELWSKTDVQNAYGIAVDALGNVYVSHYVNTGDKGIRKFDSTGNEIWFRNDVGSLGGIAVDNKFNIYVTTKATGVTVRKFEPLPEEIWNNKDVPSAKSVKIDQFGNVYSAHYVLSGQKAVRKFDSFGNELWSKTDYQYANDIDVDKLGNVYVASNTANNTQGKSVRKLDMSGQEIWSNSDVPNANAISSDSSGNVYVAYEGTLGQKLVRKFDSNGVELWSKTDVEKASGIYVDKNNHVYVSFNVGSGKKGICKYDENGNEIWSKTSYSFAQDIVADSLGNVYFVLNISSVGNPTIYKLSSDGTFIWSDSNTPSAKCITVDVDDNIYVGYHGEGGSFGKIRKLTRDKVELWVDNQVVNTYGLAVDAEKNVYAANYVPAGGKAVRKLGIPQKNKNWIVDKTDNSLSILSSFNIDINIKVNDAIVQQVDSVSKFTFELKTDLFENGLNKVEIEIVGEGYEYWFVERKGLFVEVFQWVISNNEPLPLEIELTLEGDGKLHKYLGAIG